MGLRSYPNNSTNVIQIPAFNSLALRDTFDGVDKVSQVVLAFYSSRFGFFLLLAFFTYQQPMVIFEASIVLAVEASFGIVKVGASGGITVRIEVE